ncbi:MAG: dephospho-CoA kinase [Candidatus Pacebacteria bacterium]|nr:dephospho-CoA kinase [Candidatus Paceibacterota bacterium]
MRKIIRITGQIGVGKSSLMRILRSLFTDAVFIDTDSIAKEIIKNDAQVRQKLSTCLGCMYDHENEDHTARLRQIFF